MATQIRGANNGTGTSQIKAGTISNADIHNSAAIASTKLANWSADRNAGGFKLTNLAQGSALTDGVNLGQLIAYSAGIRDWKDSVRAASTANVVVTYNATNGTSGRGQITAAPNTLDGVSLTANDRILLKDQSTGAQNGIWVVTTLGSGANGVWDRATDFDADAEVTAGLVVPVEEGTVNADTAWILSTNNPITIGGASGTALAFANFSGNITAGAGLTKTGNQIDVGTANAAIAVNADNIELVLGTSSGLEIHASGLRVASSLAGVGLTGGGGSALAVDILDEAPSGAKNGSNTAFSISAACQAAGFVFYVNGVEQEPGTDYTLSGTNLTVTVPPESTDRLRATGYKS